jgi:hypothetical protein
MRVCRPASAAFGLLVGQMLLRVQGVPLLVGVQLFAHYHPTPTFKKLESFVVLKTTAVLC